ncbi:MerR family transcriptional regulator [Thermodesulfobacteriota bacterium]
MTKKNVLIGEACRLCGVSVKQVRHWQSKGYLKDGPRIICGERAYRQFAEDDLAKIRKIKKYLDDGFTLKVASKKAADETLKGGKNYAQK